MNLFGKKKAQPKLADSVAVLREALTTLEKREKHLEKQAHAALSDAKKRSQAKDKRGAIFQLKRKKMFEKQIDQLGGKRMNIETQIMALESADANKRIFQVMKQGQSALRSTMQENDVDQVDDVMDQINENISMVDEMSEAMSQPLGSEVMDDDELEAELAMLEGESVEQELMDKPSISVARVQPQSQVDLPDVPSGPVREQPMDEDAEYAELEAMMM